MLETDNLFAEPNGYLPGVVMRAGDFFPTPTAISEGGVMGTGNRLLTSPFWAFLIRHFHFIVRDRCFTVPGCTSTWYDSWDGCDQEVVERPPQRLSGSGRETRHFVLTPTAILGGVMETGCFLLTSPI